MNEQPIPWRFGFATPSPISKPMNEIDQLKITVQNLKAELVTFNLANKNANAAILKQNAELSSLRAVVGKMEEALKDHHQWHQDQKDYHYYVPNEDEYKPIDLAEAYVESDLCDKTMEALSLAASHGVDKKIEGE